MNPEQIALIRYLLTQGRGSQPEPSPSMTGRTLRSTDDSRIIDRRNNPSWISIPPGHYEDEFNQENLGPYQPKTKPPFPYRGFGALSSEDAWTDVMNRVKAYQLVHNAIANAGQADLPPGSLYPPGMSIPGYEYRPPFGGGGGGGYSGSF